MITILHIGDDSDLLRSRAGLFAAAGLQVRNLAGAEATAAIPSARWDFAVLCHTLARAERAIIVAALRRFHPGAPILLVARGSYMPPGEAGDVDAVLSASPAVMVDALRAVVQRVSEREPEAEEELDEAEAAG